MSEVDTNCGIQKKSKVGPDQSGVDHSWSQFVQTKFTRASPSEAYFATCSPSPSSQLGQRANIRQLTSNQHRDISLRPQCIGCKDLHNDRRSASTDYRQENNRGQKLRSLGRGAAELVVIGPIHLSARKSSDPQEQAAVPMGRIVPSRSCFAAYTDSQRTHTATNRLWSRKAITPSCSGYGAIFNSCERLQVTRYHEKFCPACLAATDQTGGVA